jgi:transcriptional regulator with XRE-family HTH domain
MEFNEKLQELRKQKGLTQEELAESLYVSRTAVSKWESGRGYPNIESLKDISKYFSVSIDDLLSGEKLLSIAEKENRSNIKKMCHLLFGMIDLISITLIILPLYPNKVEDFVYSVNLFQYVQGTSFNKIVYGIAFVSLVVCGVLKILLTMLNFHNANKIFTIISIAINVFAVFYLALAGEVYAIVVAFLLVIIKSVIFFKSKVDKFIFFNVSYT